MPAYEEDSSRNGSTSPTRMFRALIRVINYLRASAGHKSEIRCASMSSDIWSRECAGPAFEQGPGMSACACVSSCACVSAGSRRMACGFWPSGLWYLAVWPLDSRRVAFPHLCTLGWGSEETRVE